MRVWPRLFEQMLSRLTYGDLSAAIDWAFLKSDSWPQYLFRFKGDPVEYFVTKVDTIIAGWRSETRKNNKSTTEPILSPSAQKMVDDWPID